MTPPSALPVVAELPRLLATLRDHHSAVLVAPPGAGKTTAVAPALLAEPWCMGQILLLAPRRIAARAAAERMAEQAGEAVGQRFGYASRLDSRFSPATRVLVVTAGVFRQRIIADPMLEGVSAVIVDEVHERGIDSDFSLALAIEAQAALRPDLRLLAMSATLDGTRFAELMGGAPLLSSEGRAFPIELHHVGRDSLRAVEVDMAHTIRHAMREVPTGDVLAFLPGVREIDRTRDELMGIDAHVIPLHGQLEPEDQRRAIAAAPDGRRKIILATSIAETSLTIDGVRIVVDSGLARRARYDVAGGTTRLVTERVSQAAATQRAGRAGRQGPGTVWRLWEAAATNGLARFDPPEILDADLAPLVLDCALWGQGDPVAMPWLDAPSAATVTDARRRLVAIGALTADGLLTDHGRALARLPLPPALAHMLLRGSALGMASLAADVAMLLSETGLGGRDVDLTVRYARWQRERGRRAEVARKTARRWARLAGGSDGGADDHDRAIAHLVAMAFPDRVARRRRADDGDYQSAGGRGYRLDPALPLARSEWIAIAEAQGAANGARILCATALDEAQVETWVAEHGVEQRHAHYDAAEDRVNAMIERRLGAITLSRVPDPAGGDLAALLLEAVRAGGLAVLPWAGDALALRARAAFAGLEALEDAALLDTLDLWLPPLLAGKRGLGAIRPNDLAGALLGQLSWEDRQQLDRLAPAYFTTGVGSRHPIDYATPGGPTVTVRVQALFGIDDHPLVGEPPVALILSLTSPAGRPIQTTRDLPRFWRGSWADVAREMRGRYPKHPWPDRPWEAPPTLRTKRADSRR